MKKEKMPVEMRIESILATLRVATRTFMPPLIDIMIAEFGHNPFITLTACLLSLRAKDSTTVHVCRDLFALITTPEQLIALPDAELERIIFRTGFYRAKARTLKNVARAIVEQHGGVVPATLEELLSIKGVGPKTANLVLGMAFSKPRICVDTHVHRISNRLGLITTKTVEQTEQALMKLLPENVWIEWNTLLVMWGQNICGPISPRCSTCSIRDYCDRRGVTTSR